MGRGGGGQWGAWCEWGVGAWPHTPGPHSEATVFVTNLACNSRPCKCFFGILYTEIMKSTSTSYMTKILTKQKMVLSTVKFVCVLVFTAVGITVEQTC